MKPLLNGAVLLVILCAACGTDGSSGGTGIRLTVDGCERFAGAARLRITLTDSSGLFDEESISLGNHALPVQLQALVDPALAGDFSIQVEVLDGDTVIARGSGTAEVIARRLAPVTVTVCDRLDGGIDAGPDLGLDLQTADQSVGDVGSPDVGACGPTVPDFQTDPMHCGRCFHDCAGGTCRDGRCQAVTIASGLQGPRAVRTDQVYVYWVETEGGSVNRLPLEASLVDRPEALATAQNHPRDLVVLSPGGTVFYVNYGTPMMADGSIGQVTKPGLFTTRLAGLINPTSIALEEGYLYWTADDGSITRAKSNDATAPEALVGFEVNPLGVVVAPGPIIYWVNFTPGGSVKTASLANAWAPTTLATSPADAVPRSVALQQDGDPAFTEAADVVAGPGRVASIHLGSTLTLAPDQHGPSRIVADGTDLYWVNEDDGTVVRLRAGATIDVLAEGQGDPFAIAVTEKYLFWVNRGAGTLVRLVKD